ncbi:MULTISPECIES: DUF4153 domain-containing protein [Mesobacillus]|uniref:DUF4153 domain-containing protein n=1 Tax=Mesobacillus TaxID=2675231 RepID=UPI00177F211C|nr:DUF4173 domain-containing protein [Mesobacillus jeotgali]MCM3573417.1 DUF4173 domain-containing protein [Mesobacillus subterraneus]UYZ23045.1 DUF4173 domain-containing protein [Mesobacillus jeotgali]
MENKLKKGDWKFFLICLALGILAERSFLHGKIGLSYPVFITVFYGVFFWRYRSYSFTNKKLGLLIIASIWLLSASFFLHSNMILYVLNILVIPVMILIQLVLVTYPLANQWHRWPFLKKLVLTVGAAIAYVYRFLIHGIKFSVRGLEESKSATIRKVLIGVAISLPLLFVIVNLLVSADQQFGNLIGAFPRWLLGLKIEEEVLRTIAISIYTLGIFGLLQVLRAKQQLPAEIPKQKDKMAWDIVISLTVLTLLNIVYFLFVVVQFQYFFSETLKEGYTYAEFARRGFFELLFVTMLNLLIISTIVSYVDKASRFMTLAIRALLSLLVIFSGVMLYSAFIRLFMYEEAYGFTFARVLAHSFMIFLLVVLCYSFMRIWMDRLSLVRFYILSAIIFYTLVNTVQLDTFVVERNIERYSETGKIDIYYLNSLSYEGVEGLVELYKLNPDHPGLSDLLLQRRQEFLDSEESWNTINMSRRSAEKALMDLEMQ